MDLALVIGLLLCAISNNSIKLPIPCAATCTQDAAALPPLKLVAFGRAVLRLTEFLIMEISCYKFYVHLTIS